MANDQQKASCCSGDDKAGSCCRIESLISIDERGQMVLPKDLRDRAKIKAGDKLALIAWEKDGEVCCLTLIKADALAQGVKSFLRPLMRDLT
jgi:AbrB family looped-hinge helix DNA binding protein